MSSSVSTTDRRAEHAGPAAAIRATWTTTYLRTAALLDSICALVAGLWALEIRFDSQGGIPAEYFALTVTLPFLWLGAVALAGGYDPRFIGTGPEAFRKLLKP